MRLLVIDEAAKQEVRRVLDYALLPENWYRPGKDRRVPGDDPRFIARLNSYRCVFTITEYPTAVFRHVSISIPVQSHFVNPYAAYTIAQLFGFTGWDEKAIRVPESWLLDVNKRDHCIQLMQPYTTPKVAA